MHSYAGFVCNWSDTQILVPKIMDQHRMEQLNNKSSLAQHSHFLAVPFRADPAQPVRISTM